WKNVETVQRDRMGSEPAVQEDLRSRIRPVRWRAFRLPGRRLLLRPDAARCGAARRDVQGRGGRSRPVHCGRVTDGHADGELAGTGQPTRSHQDLYDPGVRLVALVARIRRRPISGSGDAALSVTSAVWRQDEPGGGI